MLMLVSRINRVQICTIYTIGQFGVSRVSLYLQSRACCLIRLMSELIVRGVLLILRADHASCTNDVISRTKYSMKRADRQFGCPPTSSHGSQSRQGRRAGGRKWQPEADRCTFLHFPHCHPRSPPRSLLPHLFSHRSIHPDLGPH